MRAAINPICKRLLNPFTTARTFDASSAGVAFYCLLAALDRYCWQDFQEYASCSIQDRLGQLGASQALDVELLKRYQVIVGTKSVNHLIVKVFALVADMQMLLLIGMLVIAASAA